MNPQDYYLHPGLMSDPAEYASCLDDLPTDIPELVRIVQGMLLHIFWAERYGFPLSEERKAEVTLRTIPQKLRCLLAMDSRPLRLARPIEHRLVGNCRDFSLVLSAMLKRQGIPARARCGFGTYFIPDHFEDHWVVEYWKAAETRWVMVDAQLDDLQKEVLGITFDTLDIPAGQFVPGGRAWQMARSGEAEPGQFGIFDMNGIGFIRGNVIRDFLALNQIEILPWDAWGLISDNDEDAAEKDTALVDRIARLSLGGDEAFDELRTLYEQDTRLHAAADWVP